MNTTAAAPARPTCEFDDEADTRLVSRFQAGDQGAFDELVDRHQQRIARLVYRLLGWQSDVDDVVQEVFVTAFAGLGRFRKQSKLSTWLTAIAVNQCRSQQRRRLLWRRKRRELVQRCVNRDEQQAPNAPDQYEVVREAVRSLPKKFREPIVLRYFEQMPIAQIARALGLSTGAIEVRLSRARARLKEKLGPHFGQV